MRYGFTTGICAAAAAKASAVFLTSGEIPESVIIKNLEGHEFILKVFKLETESDSENFFGAVKDSGDEKNDVTNGLKILADVKILDGENEILFEGGEGVGMVTLPGLKIPVGEPAINPIPRKIISLALREIIPKKSLRVKISIPEGEKIALRTFNPRLGIIGGLSILGTSGFVKPMNEKALLESFSLELNMIRSLGFNEIYITFGNTGEKFLRKNFHVEGRNVIQAENYIGHVLDESARLNFERAVIAGHAGKLLKVAAGSFNTHSRISDGRIEALCTHLALAKAPHELITKVFHSNTANDAEEIIKSSGYSFIWNNIAETISLKCEKRVYSRMKIDAVFINSKGEIIGKCLK